MGGDVVTFGAVGDVAIYGQMADDVKKYGIEWPFAEVKEQLGKADVLFGNMESVAIPANFPEDKIDSDGLITQGV